ncbi:unnamed protein product, partial [Larinioides sclopetarius]
MKEKGYIRKAPFKRRINLNRIEPQNYFSQKCTFKARIQVR